MPPVIRGLDLPQAKRSVVLVLSHPRLRTLFSAPSPPSLHPTPVPKEELLSSAVGDPLLVPSVSTFSLITLISAFCPSTKHSPVSFPAWSCSLWWKGSVMGCSAVVFGNWDRVPTALLSSTYSQGCSGPLYRGALLLLVPRHPSTSISGLSSRV